MELPQWVRWPRAELLMFAWKRGWYSPPNRRVLERTIFPALAADPECQRILYVGVKWYNEGHAAAFTGRTFATIDPDATVARFGGSPHVVDVVQNLDAHFAPQSFDAIFLVGVIGYGLNDRTEVDRALAACHTALRPGGRLILGLDEQKPTHIAPKSVPASDLFEGDAHSPLGVVRAVTPLPFRECSHTFLFWRRPV